MGELIGSKCAVYYLGRDEMFPDTAIVEGVDMPMIKLRSLRYENCPSQWVNVRLIDKIQVLEG